MAAITRVYNPPPTVKKFMRCDEFMRVLMGPIGSGKSVACVMEIVRRCKEQAPGQDGKRRSRWAVVRNTLPQLKDTTLKTWLEWCPSGVAGTWKESEKTFYLKFGDVEAEILFRPLDTADDVSRVLSLELTGAWLNECREIPQELVDAVQGRIGRYPSKINGGPTWAGMIADTNSPEEDSWWHRQMELETPENWGVFRQPSGMSEEAENRENLPDDYYENLMIGKSADWINMYIHGKYGQSLTGKPVYVNTFNRDIHVVPRIEILDSVVVIGMDFGLTPACVLTQMDSFGRLRCIEEVVAFNMGLERFMDTRLLPLLRRKYADNEIIIVGDPSGTSRKDTDESTSYTVLKKKYKMKAVKASTNLPLKRIGAVEHFLTLLVEGQPAMLISQEGCPFLIQGYKSKYRYAQRRSGETNDKPDKNDWSHVHDGKQYACLYWRDGHISKAARRTENAEFMQHQQIYMPQTW